MTKYGCHPLADAWLRVDWADMHGHLFRDRSVEFFRTEPYRLWAEWNGDEWEVRFHSRTDPDAETRALTELARLLNGFLDHARAALNYTAFQVALLAVIENPSLAEPPTSGGAGFRPESVEFPIFNSQTLYRRQNRLKKLPAKYTEPIEALQPYHGGHDTLWILHELAAQYRHHLVHPAIVWPVHASHRVVVRGKEITADRIESFPQARLEPGEVLLRFNLEGVGIGVPVDPRVTLAAGIDHPLCEGREAVALLNAIVKEVGDVMETIQLTLFLRRPRSRRARSCSRGQPLAPARAPDRRALSRQGGGQV